MASGMCGTGISDHLSGKLETACFMGHDLGMGRNAQWIVAELVLCASYRRWCGGCPKANLGQLRWGNWKKDEGCNLTAGEKLTGWLQQ